VRIWFSFECAMIEVLRLIIHHGLMISEAGKHIIKILEKYIKIEKHFLIKQYLRHTYKIHQKPFFYFEIKNHIYLNSSAII